MCAHSNDVSCDLGKEREGSLSLIVHAVRRLQKWLLEVWNWARHVRIANSTAAWEFDVFIRFYCVKFSAVVFVRKGRDEQFDANNDLAFALGPLYLLDWIYVIVNLIPHWDANGKNLRLLLLLSDVVEKGENFTPLGALDRNFRKEWFRLQIGWAQIASIWADVGSLNNCKLVFLYP